MKLQVQKCCEWSSLSLSLSSFLLIQQPGQGHRLGQAWMTQTRTDRSDHWIQLPVPVWQSYYILHLLINNQWSIERRKIGWSNLIWEQRDLHLHPGLCQPWKRSNCKCFFFAAFFQSSFNGLTEFPHLGSIWENEKERTLLETHEVFLSGLECLHLKWEKKDIWQCWPEDWEWKGIEKSCRHQQ